MSSDRPQKEEGAKMHQRLLSGDEIAPAEIAEAYLELTVERLSREFSSSEYEQIQDIVVAVFEQYFEKPAKFDPERSNLAYYLYLSARGDLLNWLAARKRQPKIVYFSGSVGNGPANTEYSLEVPDPVDLEETVLENNSPVWQKINEILPEPADRQTARWLINGVKNYEPYAELLKITHLPVSEQRNIVNRNKERISKTLRRHFDRAGLENYEQ